MSVAAAQSSAFFAEVVRHREVFTIRDEGGFPAPMTSAGVRAQPFWSLETRAQRIITRVAAYGGSTPVRITLDEFRSRWIPGLARDGIRIGVNWSGDFATGYDMTPDEVLAGLTARDRR